MKEVWKDVIGYEGLYQVSNLGNIRSLDRKVQFKSKNQFTTYNVVKTFRGKDITKVVNKHGYYQISLYKNGKSKTYVVHKLVAESFIPNLYNKPTINHKDGNTLNNCINNLEWATMEEQIKHSINILGHKRIINQKCREKRKEQQQRKVKRNDGIIFNSIKEASDGNNSLRRHISEVCKGKRKTAGGYCWQYI